MEKVKKLVRQFLGLFPSKLPVGVEAFNEFVTSISNTYTLPTKDETTIKFVLASEIMRLGPLDTKKSKYYFYLVLQAAAAKQIAGFMFSEVKRLQKEAEVAAKKAADEAAIAAKMNLG